MLLPVLRELATGNAIPNYLRCVLGQEENSESDLPDGELLRLADRAARMDKPDCQLLPKLKTDGVGLLLPDVQKMRQPGSGLQGRFRDEAALGRFDDAVVTAKTMFALARHTGDHLTLIGDLVAFALSQFTLEEMIGQPGCPNFYWALAALPQPFVSLGKGLEGERLLLDAELSDLDARTTMPAGQLKKLIMRLDRLRFQGDKALDWLVRKAKDSDHMAGVSKRQRANGVPEYRLGLFSPYRVLLLDDKLEYEIQRGEAMKLMPLPTWEAVARLKKLPDAKGRPIVDNVFTNLDKIRLPQGRLDQRFALVRHVEALLHAAAHAGELPAKLSEVEVPPADPFTGRPFRYELIDGVARLRGTPPVGYGDNAAYNFHYEITIRK